ncbi:MAG: tRNA pseudouridine(13) synthase TruD [Candidatus Diapherotrites archaeon]|uniref:Probable tRNA pseudouridine synthase D n=1 Tax=Candidatus Iainarchaeum sp. TaxID=3101447 RepID=A0A7K4BZY2_9ARCH|nr:tRNA pseudouridine(13) synthase TruD [Candidatus Diapherotrites archaeon]
MDKEILFITNTPPLKGKIKQRYSDFIVEEVTREGICEVQRYNKPLEKRNFEKMRIPEKPENKEHLILEMEKINTDTNTAIALISRGINTSKKRIGYAGLKDKRGITAQRISIYQPDIKKIENFGVKGIELRNPKWGERIELGELQGNNFTITIRDISETKEEIEKIVQQFVFECGGGIPNYFGNQRFGGKRQITHRVGKLLLLQDFKSAIELYLTETYEEEKPNLKNARINLAKTMDYSKALKEFPFEARTERAILNHLVQHPNDYANAFSVLPKKMRYLFTHAYQSYLFNKMIKERIKILGKKALTPQEGDILEEGEVTALLPGYESEFAKGIQGEIEQKILQEENMELKNFKVDRIAEISSQGSRKKISLKPQNMYLDKIGEDEFNEGKKYATIKFYLTKGNYATTIMQELIKEEIF